jgi:hypothetical protein
MVVSMRIESPNTVPRSSTPDASSSSPSKAQSQSAGGKGRPQISARSFPFPANQAPTQQIAQTNRPPTQPAGPDAGAYAIDPRYLQNPSTDSNGVITAANYPNRYFANVDAHTVEVTAFNPGNNSWRVQDPHTSQLGPVAYKSQEDGQWKLASSDRQAAPVQQATQQETSSQQILSSQQQAPTQQSLPVAQGTGFAAPGMFPQDAGRIAQGMSQAISTINRTINTPTSNWTPYQRSVMQNLFGPEIFTPQGREMFNGRIGEIAGAMQRSMNGQGATIAVRDDRGGWNPGTSYGNTVELGVSRVRGDIQGLTQTLIHEFAHQTYAAGTPYATHDPSGNQSTAPGQEGEYVSYPTQMPYTNYQIYPHIGGQLSIADVTAYGAMVGGGYQY